MPLPRFARIPDDQRRAILDVARHEFATHGATTASYNKIIEAAGISKSTAYQYFDGRDDLLDAVLADLRDRIASLLGDWPSAPSETAFWHQLNRDGAQLHRHLADNVDDLALVDDASARALPDGSDAGTRWLEQVIANGRDLGIVRTDTEPELLLASTAAVMQSVDRWAIEKIRENPEFSSSELEQGYRLLAALWSGPR